MELDILIAKALDGDSRAENDLFEYLYVRFTSFATLRTGVGEAHDLALEACRIVLLKYKNQTFTRGFESWAYGVLKNVLRNYYRSSRIHNRIMVPEPEVEKITELTGRPDHDLRITLIDCLKKIKEIQPRYARALIMISKGYKAAEISSKMEINLDNFYVVLNRSRRLLKKCLETGGV